MQTKNLIAIPENAPLAYVYGCSPRAGGNSDYAAMLIQRELADQGLDYDGCFLREYDVTSCGGCQRCADIEHGICRFAAKDEAGELFEPLLGSQLLFFVSPIYFYHLPSVFKAFIDRGQAFWVQRRQGNPKMLALPPRKAHVVLLAAREKGGKMFEGSLLTLRFFLKAFNVELAEPLLLRQVDNEDDLAGNAQFQKLIYDYARRASAGFVCLC